MKHFTLATLAFLTAWPLRAQDAKMDWKHDFKAALAEAQKNKKYIVLHFMGSN